MKKHLERGALSLVGCAVFMAVLSFAAIAALMFMRGGSNIFTDAFNRAMGKPSASAPQPKTQTIEGPAIKAGAGHVQKCMVNGHVVYSNVGCPNQRTGTIIELNDSQGIEAPKSPPAPVAAQGSQPQANAMER